LRIRENKGKEKEGGIAPLSPLAEEKAVVDPTLPEMKDEVEFLGKRKLSEQLSEEELHELTFE